jgi:(S)-2-hydroxyglutarate dehydrogenase
MSTALVRRVDFLIVGGGVIGLNVALGLRSRHPARTIAVLEKEVEVGLHGSGRNSGVLHAGFYYSADSLKGTLQHLELICTARFTREGNEMLRSYIENKGLSINKCGKVAFIHSRSSCSKLVVASAPEELDGLDLLFERGKVSRFTCF